MPQHTVESALTDRFAIEYQFGVEGFLIIAVGLQKNREPLFWQIALPVVVHINGVERRNMEVFAELDVSDVQCAESRAVHSCDFHPRVYY